MVDAAADRILAGTAAAARRRALAVRGGEVLERDGLVLALTNLSDPALNGAYVEREPADPERALAWVAAETGAHGHPLGIDYPSGRFPRLDDAVRALGLELVESRSAMAADPSGLPAVEPPAGVSIRPVETRSDALALAEVDAEAWGGEVEHSIRAFADGVVGVAEVTAFVAWNGATAVGCAVAHHHERSVGIFGVGVVPRARRRGLGRALTISATRAVRSDLAWLFPTEMAVSLYRELGFREIETWEVWAGRGADR